MQKTILPALIVALISGLAIGIQAAFISGAGKIAGAVLTGLLVTFMGGIAAGALLVVITVQQGTQAFSVIQSPTLVMIVAAGLLSVAIITGVAYALPKIGIAAGLSSVIAGQMVVAILVDTLGLAGGQPIPLNWTRVGGLALLGLGTWFILPKS